MRRIIAIDPGNRESGYVILSADQHGNVECIEDKGKIKNEQLRSLLRMQSEAFEMPVEMVACYGMPVGAEVFEVCVWIGRFLESAISTGKMLRTERIYRKDEKINLCGTMKAKDGNISQALIDRFASGVPNRGKGTKKAPGFFYGFKADIWQAMAVGVTYLDLEREGRYAHHT